MFGWLRRRSAPPKSRRAPGEIEAALALARQALDSGRDADALAALAPVLGDSVVHPEGCHLAAIVACRRGDFPEAVRQLEAATAVAPERLESWHTLAEVRLELGQPDAAVAALRALLEADPGYRPAHGRLVMALHAAGQADEALEAYQMHRLLEWRFDPARNPAARLHAQGRLADAVMLLRERLAAAPGAGLWHLLGLTRQAQAHLDTAIACFREAVHADPAAAAAHRSLAFALDTAGDLEAAMPHYERAVALCPDDPQVASDHLAARLYTGWSDPQMARAALSDYDQRFGAARHGARRPAGAPAADRRLKVGYVSNDLCSHAIAHFLEPVLECHDRNAFEVICYDRTPQRDAVSLRLEAAADGWRRVDGMDWDRLADQVRADGIDILVDLKGHFDDNHLPLFARRPAPVQVTWLGYPDTTGLSCVDAWLSDQRIIEGAREQQASEQLASLGPFFMCFRPAPGVTPVSALPALARGHVTFGCFNTWSKVSPAMREAMAAILRAVPGSRLLVTAAPGGDTRARFLEFLERQGVAPERVEIRGRGSHEDFMRAHDEVDITLDSFPYNGTTTALHSLWLGVPFVALEGATHVSRVGQGILRNVGLDAWVASSVEDYVRLAVSHASDLAALAVLRDELRQRLAQSVIMDEPGFTRRLEAVYGALWRNIAAGVAAG